MSTLRQKVEETFLRIEARGDDGVWISLLPKEDVLRWAGVLDADPRPLPLRGLTFAIKDNIDLADLPTTAACPDFSYTPGKSATVVQRLLDAGAIAIGKTNLDQFATGLNGTRTPYTIPRNSINPNYIPGGSSSGSALAVALGEVDFALGTDTAGSGRVPAAFNNLIGFKPTKGSWSTAGVVPACRSLDCVTVFTRNLREAMAVDAVACALDPDDPFSRLKLSGPVSCPARIGVLRSDQREFFGDAEYGALYQAAVARLTALGFEVEEFDYEPLLEAAGLLYSGPWVAERFAAVGDFLAGDPSSAHPVVRELIEGGRKFTAVDAFRGQYQLARYAGEMAALWQRFDSVLLPTAPTIYTVSEMLADPVNLNSRLGRYTNFVNLLDCCGIAVPAGFRRDGLPFGVTFIGPAWTDHAQAEAAALFLGEPWTPLLGGIRLAVVGAHLRGQPLNKQLLELGARFIRETHTAPSYRLFALPDTVPPKPGMVRSADGRPIQVEVWELSETTFGRFVNDVPSPLCIGAVELGDGEMVKGFLCEDVALDGAHEITSFGGWRAYRNSL